MLLRCDHAPEVFFRSLTKPTSVEPWHGVQQGTKLGRLGDAIELSVDNITMMPSRATFLRLAGMSGKRHGNGCSQIYRFLILHAKQDSHGILILVESVSWWANPITEQSLHLSGEWSGCFRWHHQVLVLTLSVKAFGEEKADILSDFVPEKNKKSVKVHWKRTATHFLLGYVGTTSVVGVSQKQESVADFEFGRNGFMDFRRSFRTPYVRPRDHLGGPVLVGDFGNGHNTTEHHGPVALTWVQVPACQGQRFAIFAWRKGKGKERIVDSRIIPMKFLSSTSWINSEGGGG